MEAIAVFDQAIALDSRQPDAWLGRGQALESLGRYAEAWRAYEQVLTLNPGNRVVQERRDALELLV
jgi:Flp pilus assembly protein TadD